jgi:hypothetical protein
MWVKLSPLGEGIGTEMALQYGDVYPAWEVSMTQ